ncbi:MAG: PQQ-binding-like beta-propeller repeat protein [Myxococcales bacterium]|nr:PQQ-binding-like beta-propeller repeat protein [Myxococcales bacterium]
MSESSGDPGETAAPTTGEPTPAVCGDGVLGDGEACDDGNAADDDGCDVACARTGKLAWTWTEPAPFVASDITVGVDGRIVIVGGDTVLALSPAGAELWRRALPGAVSLATVVVDAAGNIYTGSRDGVVHGLDPAGLHQWISGIKDDPDSAVRTEITALVLHGDTLHALAMRGAKAEYSTLLRRIDPGSGVQLTETPSPADITAIGRDLAVGADTIVAVGVAGQLADAIDPQLMRAFVATYDLDGAALSFTVADDPGPEFRSITATADGYVLTGVDPLAATIIVRGLDPDLHTQWDREDQTFPAPLMYSVAAGPGGALALAGRVELGDEKAALVRRLASGGDPMWTSVLTSPDDTGIGGAFALAFGPDFLVALGPDIAQTGDWTVWVRRFAID